MEFNVTKDMIKMPEVVNVTTKSGDTVEVQKWISYENKERLAQIIVQFISIEDKENEVYTLSWRWPLVETISMIAFYTNINADLTGGFQSWMELYDWLVSEEVLDKIYEVIADDWKRCDEMINLMIDAVKEQYEQQHSLAHLIKKVIGDVSNTDDMNKQIEMIQEAAGSLNLLNDRNAKEDRPVVKDGKLYTNGQVFDFKKNDK